MTGRKAPTPAPDPSAKPASPPKPPPRKPPALELPPVLQAVRSRLARAFNIAVLAPPWDDEETYVNADQATAIGEVLVGAVHKLLTNARIVYLFRKKMTTKGVQQIAKASATSSRERYLAEVDFVIEINWEIYRTLSPRARVAWIDHELAHCDRDAETSAWRIRLHDVEEFLEVVQRWGTYHSGLSQLARTLQQMDLFDEEPTAADREAEADAVQRVESVRVPSPVLAVET